MAVSVDGLRWVLLDAAPEMRHQIIDAPALHPQGEGRHSPIEAVVLTSGDVDHLAGLLTLREGHVFILLASPSVLDGMRSSPIFAVLNPERVTRKPLQLEHSISIAGLEITPFAVPGKVPLYRETGEVAIGEETDAVIGLIVSDGSRSCCYVPGVAHLTPTLVARLGAADLLFLDGTAYADDELPRLGLSTKTAGRMGHLAITGPHGSLRAFRDARARRVLIHLNNTNPVLVEGSAEHVAVEAAGWEVAYDGMEIAL